MANVSQKIQTFLGGVSRKADFDKFQGQVVEADNCYPDETYGMIKRPGTELLGTLGIDYDTANGLYFFPLIREGQPRYLVGVGDGSIRMWSLDDPSVAITVNAPGGLSYLDFTNYNDIAVNDAYRSASDDRRTVIVNRTKVCAENTTFWSTGVDIDGNGSVDGFTWTNRNKNKNANSIDDLPDGRAVRVHVTGGGNASSTRPLREGVHYLPVTVDEFDNQGDRIVTEGAGLVIKCQVNAQGFIDASNLADCEIWAAGSGYPDQCPASIDGIPNSRLTIATGLRPAMVYRVVNSNADHDDMYLQAFSNETTSDDFPGYVPGPRDRVDGPYLWKECPSPESYVGLDPSTLPHELIQVNSTTFTFQPIDYSYRWAGDNTNNPAPSFIGSTVNNTFFMNNRLGFLSEDNVILSRPINYGPSYATPQDYVPSDNPWVMRNYTEVDFFRQSVIGLNDADPIDIKAANNNTSIFHTAISTPQGTILFADGQQSLLFQPQGLLSPLTASINSLSNYDMTGDVNAVIIGEKYFFVNKSAKFCRIYSMINQGMQNPPIIEDVTKEVADWLPNDMTDLVGCPTDRMIFVFNRTRNDVYVRREIGEGSSWVKWTHSHPVVSLVVDHDLIFFMTSSEDDVQVSMARLYLLPDDYTLKQSEITYPEETFTTIPADYNYYKNIVGNTSLNDGLTGTLEYFKPWHSYYGDLAQDSSANDTFDQWLPWEDSTPVNTLISVSADETVSSEEEPWNVGFKLTVRSAAGSTQRSNNDRTTILPYDTKFRIRNTSGQPDTTAFDSTLTRCDTTPVHVGPNPPDYDRVRYVGTLRTDGTARLWDAQGNSDDTSIVTPWIEKNPNFPLSTGWQGDPYLYVGGNWACIPYGYCDWQIVDHLSGSTSSWTEWTPWVNYGNSFNPGNNNGCFGSVCTDGKIGVPWRSRVVYRSSGGYDFRYGDIGGFGFLGPSGYARGYSSNPPDYFNISQYGQSGSYGEIDGYWQFEKDGVITNWAGYDADGSLRTTSSISPPCDQPFDPTQYAYWRYVGQMTNNTHTTYHPGSYGGVNIGASLSSDGSITTTWRSNANGQAAYVGSAYATNPATMNYAFIGDFIGASPHTGTAGTTTFPIKQARWRANVTVTNTGLAEAAMGNMYIGDIGQLDANNNPFNSPQPWQGGAFSAGDFRAGLPLEPDINNTPNPGVVTINGRWEFSHDGQTVAASWGGLDDQGNDVDQAAQSSSDQCCNDVYVVNTDGTESNTGVSAKSIEIIPDGDEVILRYVPCSGPSTFIPESYRYAKFVGQATITGHPSDAGVMSRFQGNWIDVNTGAIETDWIEFGNYMNIGGPFYNRLTVGGGALRLLSIDNIDGGPLNVQKEGQSYTNTWSPTVNYYNNEAYSSTFGQTFGDTTNNGQNGVKWLNTVTVNIGAISGYGGNGVYFGGIYTGGTNDYVATPGGAQYMCVALDGNHEYTGSNGALKLYPSNRVGTITGHWEFTNDTSKGTDLIWGGINADGTSSTDFVYTKRYPASTFKTAYIKIVPTECCPCPTEPSPTITLNSLSLDPNMDLYTTSVTVSGTTVTPPASFPKLLGRKMSYVIANLPGSTAVASDRAGDAGTLTWNDDHTLTADTDLTGYESSLIVGYNFDYNLILPTFYYNQGNSDYDYTASLTISRVKFAIGLSGQAAFEINVRNGPGWESTYSQVISNEYLASTAPISSPAIVSVPVHKRNSDFQLLVKSDGPFPLSVDSCMWEGIYSPRYYRRT